MAKLAFELVFYYITRKLVHSYMGYLNTYDFYDNKECFKPWSYVKLIMTTPIKNLTIFLHDLLWPNIVYHILLCTQLCGSVRRSFLCTYGEEG